jgi:DNA recombination protein RmuC
MVNLGIIIILLVVIVVLLGILLFKSPGRKFEELKLKIELVEKDHDRIEKALKEEMAQNREDFRSEARQLREEFHKLFTNFIQTNEQKLELLRGSVEERLKSLQDENSKKLDQMREVVDEKLHSTLEKRLNDSFKLVSERLEMVYRGLGEMQNLASSVGDLKKVLSNVKTRGIVGEIQLGVLLEQILTEDQYARNVKTKRGSSESVEFAIKLPGRDDKNTPVWLPVDAKFHIEDYNRLLEAYEKGDVSLIEECKKNLENKILDSARDISNKYLDPPNTTDFAIMFLPVEGLYAEVIRMPGLFENLQRKYRVTVTGPTTLSAFLNSLQMGFRTLAIEKRSSEIWSLLAAIKTEFEKFGFYIEKTRDKLQEATNKLDEVSKRSRIIGRKLRDVQKLPEAEALKLIGDEGALEDEET